MMRPVPSVVGRLFAANWETNLSAMGVGGTDVFSLTTWQAQLPFVQWMTVDPSLVETDAD
ncbi:hypothetical protein GCM10025858_21230 [Alicyclobacillus sacchari]|nr:hypothetical protein GCM10025858_21230 [Alicyclobacillus sacchari]